MSVMAPKLDIKDVAILTYLINLGNSDSDKIEWYKNRELFFDFEKDEGVLMKRFFWTDFKTLGRKMPLLRLKSSSAIKQRILKLQRHGFLVRRHFQKYKPIIYLGDKCNLCWVNHLEKECHGCTDFCESGCSIYDDIKPVENVLNKYFRFEAPKIPDDPVLSKNPPSPSGQAQGRGCDV